MKSHAPFPTTHWTLVHSVRDGSPEEAAKAMEAICGHYWFPIYAYLRRSGRNPHDAEDLTQAFFVRLLTGDDIKGARQDRGRLRTFLLAVLVRMLANQGRHDKALKRGGGQIVVSFDEMEAEERYRQEPQDTRDPEWIFTQAWAHALFAGVRDKLRTAVAATGRAETFDVLLPFLTLEDEPPSYREVAARLGSSEAGTRLLIFRLRTKFRDLLREEVSHTVLDEEELDGELAWLKSGTFCEMIAGKWG